MSREWSVKRLEEVIGIQRGHDLPTSIRIKGNIPIMGSFGITGWHNVSKTKGPGVTVGRSGGSMGVVNFIDKDYWPLNTTLYVTDFKGNDPFFVYLLLSQINFTQYNSGSAQPSLNRNIIYGLELYLPPLPEQKAIAKILGDLDNKIELNRKMNQTLEEMAQALFKSWFVDFDLVLDNAIAAGNTIPEALQVKAEKRKLVREKADSPSLSKEMQELFPNSFVFNKELDKWIPEGWEKTSLNECLSTISKTYNLKEIEKIIFLNTGDIQEGRFLHKDYSDTIGLPGQAKKSIQKGDILYSEIRPKNKRFAYVFFDSNDYVVSTKLMVLRPNNDIDALFYYQILKSDSTINELQFLAESRSGTFPQITYDTLKAINFVLPHEMGLIEHYTAFLKTNFDRSIEAQKQTETLTKLRDTLLPQLISGKLRVPEAMMKEGY
jgi:type I restriction enzyme S subunit